MHKLPIGIQTFREIIVNNYIYIDKTDFALNLILNYKYVLLSRPRRFGKSLFLNTLKEIFNGERELFKGLYIYDRYDFEHYPVIYINWSGIEYDDIETTKKMAISILIDNKNEFKLEFEDTENPIIYFKKLIQEIYKIYQKEIVILIDEYDKPIFSNINNKELALQNESFLKAFYDVLKVNDEFIKFVFFTGVSDFSKENISESLTEFEDISLNANFGNICGYTQYDVEKNFKYYLKGVNLETLSNWYKGYNFLGDKLYSPFDILKFIKNDKVFRDYATEGYDLAFIKDLLNKDYYNISSLSNLVVEEEFLNNLEINNPKLSEFLYQIGYLTIDEFIQKRNRIEYKLKFSNLEIQITLNMLFIDYLTNNIDYSIQDSLFETLEIGNLSLFEKVLISLYDEINFYAVDIYNRYIKNSAKEALGYYFDIFYSYLAASGLNIMLESKIDLEKKYLTVMVEDKIYIIEFKLYEEEHKFIEHYNLEKLKKYANKYIQKQSPYVVFDVYFVVIEFDVENKNLNKFMWDAKIL